MSSKKEINPDQRLIKRSAGTSKSLAAETFDFGIREVEIYQFTSTTDYVRLPQSLLDI